MIPLLLLVDGGVLKRSLETLPAGLGFAWAHGPGVALGLARARARRQPGAIYLDRGKRRAGALPPVLREGSPGILAPGLPRRSGAGLRLVLHAPAVLPAFFSAGSGVPVTGSAADGALGDGIPSAWVQAGADGRGEAGQSLRKPLASDPPLAPAR